MQGRYSHIHLDPVGGIAGDMFMAALVDLDPDLAPGAVAAMRDAGLPAACTPAFSDAQGQGLTGRRFALDARSDTLPHHDPRYGAIRAALEASALAAPVKARAQDIFALLAEAEAQVHGIAIDAVHFHELAAWDSIADVVGAAFLIENLGVRGWSVGPLPLGGGRIRVQHGTLPVPAPATTILLEGFTVFDDGLEGERVTPTGAAILKHLAPAPAKPSMPHRLGGQGLGFGTRPLPDTPNCLRVLALAPVGAGDAPGPIRENVGVIVFEIDDQSPEDLAIGLDNLRQTDDVLDVIQLQAVGKKGRMAIQIQVLCRADRIDGVAEACLRETTTIGLRCQVVGRLALPRALHEGPHAVKVASRPGGTRTAKVEAADLENVEGGHAGRRQAARQAEDAALAAVKTDRNGGPDR